MRLHSKANSSLLRAQKTMAPRSPVRILREAPEECARCFGAEEVGLWYPRKGQDALGGRAVQARAGIPGR